MNPQRQSFLTLLGSLLIVALFFVLLKEFNLEPLLLDVLQSVESAGLKGQVVFTGVVVLAVVTVVPSVLLTLGAGALYGAVLGSFIIIVAETLGAIIAFFLGRYVLHKPATRVLKNRQRLQQAITVADPDDWMLIALLRMIPFFPFKLSNYVLGLTAISLRSFVFGTFIGLWPVTFFNVYLGSLAGELMSLDQAGASRTTAHWAVYAAGLIFTGVIMVIAVRRASRALNTAK